MPVDDGSISLTVVAVLVVATLSSMMVMMVMVKEAAVKGGAGQRGPLNFVLSWTSMKQWEGRELSQLGAD